MNSHYDILSSLALGFLVLAISGCRTNKLNTTKKADIEQTAETILKLDPINAQEVEANFESGVLTIDGLVEDSSTKQLAAESVNEIVGVKQVENELSFSKTKKTALEVLNNW